MKQKIVIIFDIYNMQEDYAKCMTFIEGVENKNLKIDDDDWKTIIEEEKVSHMVLDSENEWLLNNGTWNFKKIVPTIEKGRCDIIKLKKYGPITNPNSFIAEYDKNKEYFYYFRIHTSKEGSLLELKSIQYYYLFQQQFENLKHRMGAIMLPFEGNYINKTKEKNFSSTYFRYSHYTRWLASYAPIYGVIYSKEEVAFMPLTKKKSGIQNSFFPLMEINEEMLQNMQRSFRFALEDDKLVLLNCTNIYMQDIVSICNRFLEESVKSITGIRKNERIKIILEWIVRESNQGRGFSVLELALFVNLVTQKAIMDPETMKKSMYLVSNLNEGLLQLFENVVRHSEKKKGLFSFALHTREKMFWELYVLDSNRKENLVDNFLKHSQVKDSALDKLKSDICMAHFFKDYSEQSYKNGDIVNAWKNFREKNRVSCLGLPHLADLLKSCKAALMAVSSNVYRNYDNRLVYVRDYGELIEERKFLASWSIPGTQFYICCEVKLTESYAYYADTPISMLGNLIQNDKVYADFVDWGSEEFILQNINLEERYCETVSDNARKMYLAQKWKEAVNYSLRRLEKQKVIYYLDVEKTKTTGDVFQTEALCKGLIDSSLLDHTWIKYFAFVNCSDEMMRIFYRTLQGSSVLMHPELQLYFVSEDSMKELFLSGETGESIASNAREYSFCRGMMPVIISETKKATESRNKIEVCPFDVLLKFQISNNLKTSVFERYIDNIADYELADVKRAGYKLINTHMRLGSKVHLRDFYEISHLFQKSLIAQKFAFLIIQQMLEKVKESGTHILFYGYASYSRMILESLTEIAYIINPDACFEFAVYQNDIYLQRTAEEISPTIKMYFSNPCINSEKKQPIDSKTAIVQIVPISTTMTTFNKMWTTFKKNIVLSESDNILINIYKNITLFWVGARGGFDDYYEAVEGNQIITHLIQPSPVYYIKKETEWENALECKLCYPKEVMDEKPLIETDATSTIPSQQLEVSDVKASFEVDKVNEERILSLRNSVYYGHILRETNHYQFYIQTATYFHEEKEKIKQWLINLRSQKKLPDNILHILAVPKHHTNVEFSYYVNNYYYQGKAHMLIVDSAKEFRSNFIGKYADIRELINKADEEGIEIQITYVDDNVITGSTFQRVNSLLHSLVPIHLKKPIQCDKVFVLINRLSKASQVNYVKNPKENFHSYVNVSISSIRTYGSSCVMCNLGKEAQKFHQKASIKMLADYWQNKVVTYEAQPFDKITRDPNSWGGFYRFLCAHEARECICKESNSNKMILSIIRLFELLREEENKETPIFNVLRRNRKVALYGFMKVLCRPFFSFGRIFKECILDFYLLLAEDYLNVNWKDVEKEKLHKRLSAKSYLLDDEVWKRLLDVLEFIHETISKEDEMEFILCYILEGLCDLRSNYFMRKHSIRNITHYIHSQNMNNKNSQLQHFYTQWLILIYRLVNGSTDETKCLWLEVLLTYWDEYLEISEESKVCSTKKICCELQISGEESQYFVEFWNNLIISNTRIYIENVEKCSCEQDIDIIWNDYYLNNLKKFLQVDSGSLPACLEQREIQKCFSNMVRLSAHLRKNDNSDVKEKYEQLHACLCTLLDEDSIWIFGENQNIEYGAKYYSIAGRDNVSSYASREVKQIIEKDLKKELDNYGYFIDESNILLKIMTDDDGGKIAPIFIFIQCKRKESFVLIRNIRKVMTFRHQLLQWVKEDFKSNAIQIMKQAENSNRHLEIDKSGHHLSPMDMNAIKAELESTISMNGDIDYAIRDWLLLKFYVNTRISKIYRAIWANPNDYINKREFLYYNRETKEEYEQEPIKPLYALTQLFWGEDLKKNHSGTVCYSAKSYLKIFEPIIYVTFEGKKIKNILELEKEFQPFECISCDKVFYRRDYMACMIMDILFSAIRCGFNWDIPYIYDEVAERFLENDSRLHYWFLKNHCLEEFKCTVDFSVEICKENSEVAYLVISNPVYLGTQRDIDRRNEELEAVLDGDIMKGLSLNTIAWYINNLDKSNRLPKVKCFYTMKQADAYFVIKLPIIKIGEENGKHITD